MKRILAFAGAVLVVAAPSAAQAPDLAMLHSLERGSWEVRIRGDESPRRVCVRNGTELIQIRHSQPNCSRFVVEDEANRVTVQYTCPGHGYGRTTIRKENGRLVQIESQGIVDGRPFQFSAEGRRVGGC